MSKVLYITANPKTVDQSVSLKLGEEFLKTYQRVKTDDEIIKIDLYKTDIPEIDFDLLIIIENLKQGISPEQLSEQRLEQFERYNAFTDQFVAADKYVFVTPMWNLGLPARLKTYIDAVCVAGKSFKYTDKGPQGLLMNKRCLHLHASGGFHENDPMNHADPFLKDIMNFMGVQDYRSLVVEGHNAIPDRAEAIIKEAHAQIPTVVDWFSVTV